MSKTLCFRARQDGVKMYCDSRVKIWHIGSKVYDETNYQLQKQADAIYRRKKPEIWPENRSKTEL